MNADQTGRLFTLFDEAVELPPAERAAFLEGACAGDAALRAEVEAMLAADAAANPLFDATPAALLDALPETGSLHLEGQRVGPYRILRELGRGGMGAVYLAVREDVGKQVALKLVRGALAAPEYVKRFLAERRILARLEHPHIASLLDAGVAPDGTPWFAMERVEGGPITSEADRRRLPIAERLRLFEQVCEAVAHAHRHRIVHRDLKPSNILVDAEGRVKLLDFGIAKLLGEEGSDEGLTRTGVRPMTPEYAAPEQVRGEPVTPATDVYALGAVFYELLSGHRPQRVNGGSLAEVERAVLQTDPPLPSAAAVRPAEVASARATDPQRLRRRLSGDLDAIVMRAMAKEPRRRYASAAELLADLRAHRHGLPISARPYTWRYRSRRFAARHPVTVGLAAALAAVIVGTTILTPTGTREAAAGRGSLGSIAAPTTRSPQALSAFLEGELELREGRYARAAAAFRRAVDADSTFALAYYGISRAAHWMNNVVAESNAAQMALRHAERLAPQDRMLIEAWSFYREGRVVQADSLYRALLRVRPNDVEVSMQLGEIGFHFGSMLGHPAAESRQAFERVLASEPDNVGALVHLARLAAREGAHERMDSLVRRVLALDPEGEQGFQLSVLRSLARGEPELPRRLQERLLLVDAAALRAMVTATASQSGRLERARWLAELTAERLEFHTGGAWAQLMAAQLEVAAGRWRAAQRRLEIVGRRAPDLENEFRAAYLAAPVLEAPAAEIAAARSALARTSNATTILAAHAIEQRRRLLLGMLSVRLGDTAAARLHADSLARYARASTAGDSAFSRRLALDLRAQLAWHDRRPADALALLGPPGPQPDHMRSSITSYYKARERWLRAELLRELGRDEEALRWYATFPDPDAYDLVYLAPSHLRRAEIHEQRGERGQAAEHYRRFVELWRDADPQLQPLVRQAGERIERLELGG